MIAVAGIRPRLTGRYAIRTLKVMEVQFTPDQKAFVRQAIESGRLRREEDAVQEAMSLWEERERRRLEILMAVEEAEASLARGEGRRITTHEEVIQLADDIKRRGRARLAADQNLR
jgi:Arc/MetJ-type ribon-helix-helix transcriptional regulator